MFKLLMALKEKIFYFVDYDTYKITRCHNVEYHNVNPAAYIRHTLYQQLYTDERFINLLILTCFDLSY